MKLSDYDFDLPPERIAQAPPERREAARLLVHDLTSNRTHHGHVHELPGLLDPGDLLVVNDTRVLPARLLGRRASGGRVEFLFLEPRPSVGATSWSALVNPARKPNPGEWIDVVGTPLRVRMLARQGKTWDCDVWEDGLSAADSRPVLDVPAALKRHGRMPLPPYVERDDVAPDARDRERYQTVFARCDGAVAAPTAGLHLSEQLLGELKARGVERSAVTLHVGRGTFEPVKVDDIAAHRMHAERYELGSETVAAVAAARARNARIVAVGTTSTRTLEACATTDRGVRPGTGSTELFLRPGSRFEVVDALLTNFHLPRSTLLLLVAAFAGRERVLALYEEAIERGYRFYSYGDAMLLGRGLLPQS